MRARICHGAFSVRVRSFLHPLIVRFHMAAMHYRQLRRYVAFLSLMQDNGTNTTKYLGFVFIYWYR